MRLGLIFLLGFLAVLKPAITQAQIDMDIEDAVVESKNKSHFSVRTAITSPFLVNMPSNVVSKPFSNLGIEGSFLFSMNRHTEQFNMTTGLILSFNNYTSNVSSWLFNRDSLSEEYVPVVYPENSAYKKNKMSWSYLRLPAEMNLRFGNKADKQFGIDMGAYISLLLTACNIYIVDLTKTKTICRNQLNPFAFGVHSSLVYGKLSLKASMDINSLFRSENAPNVQLFTLGLSYTFIPPIM